MMLNKYILTSLIVLIAFLAGCGSVPPVPTDKYYQLSDLQAGKADTTLGTIAIKRFITKGLHNGRPILYVNENQPLKIEAYHYHHWVDAPPRLVQENMVSYLRSSNIAKQVTSYSTAAKPDIIIAGKIRNFEQILGSKPRVIVALEIQVTYDGHRQPVLLKDYRVELETGSESVHEAAKEFSLALAKIYTAFLKDLSAVNP